jgi:predicted DNA-binding transcriptional regulator YafY
MKKSDPEKKRGYEVNPLGTVLDNGYYNLFCYDDFFGNISHYRIDRMDNVKMLDGDLTKAAAAESFDLSARKRQLFSMFGGRLERVEIHADKSLIDVIYDKFGGTMYLMNRNNDLVGFTADVQVSPTFFAWCCAYGDKLKIVSPASVVDELRAYISSISSQYE